MLVSMLQGNRTNRVGSGAREMVYLKELVRVSVEAGTSNR